MFLPAGLQPAARVPSRYPSLPGLQPPGSAGTQNPALGSGLPASSHAQGDATLLVPPLPPRGSARHLGYTKTAVLSPYLYSREPSWDRQPASIDPSLKLSPPSETHSSYPSVALSTFCPHSPTLPTSTPTHPAPDKTYVSLEGRTLTEKYV